MRVLSALLFASTVVTGCASESSEPERIDITPAGGKQDGAASIYLDLTADTPRQGLMVHCNEWINCDLQIKLKGKPGTKVQVRALETQQRWDFVLSDVFTCDAATAVQVLQPRDTPTPGSGMSCKDVPYARVHSDDAGEVFNIDVTLASRREPDYVFLEASWW